MPDRFSEDEARRIFARAAERQHAEQQRPEGLSLVELQEIGRAAGLDPEHVAAAVAEVRDGGGRSGAVVWGVEMEPHAARTVPGEVDDATWAQMVALFRRTFKTKGAPTDVGRAREWTGTNSQGGLSNLLLRAEPVEGGTLITLETSRATEAAQMRGLPWIFAAASVALIALFLAAGDGSAMAAVLVGILPLVLVAGVTLAARRGYRRWSETRQGQFTSLLDQYEGIVRSGTAEPPLEQTAEAPASPAAPPTLDFDGLADDVAVEDEAPAQRRRVR